MNKTKILRNTFLVISIILMFLGNIITVPKSTDDYEYFTCNSTKNSHGRVKVEKLVPFAKWSQLEKGSMKEVSVTGIYYAYVDENGNYGVVYLTEDRTDESVVALENSNLSDSEPIYIYGRAMELTDKIRTKYSNELEGVSANDLGQVYLNGQITPEKETCPIFGILLIISFVAFIVFFVKYIMEQRKIKKENINQPTTHTTDM